MKLKKHAEKSPRETPSVDIDSTATDAFIRSEIALWPRG
jgi:hypothetical protein